MYKRHSLILIILFMLPILCAGGVNYIVDPLQIYQKAPESRCWFWENQRFQNAGKIHSYLETGDYQSVLIGNSVADCFVPDEIEKSFGWGNLIKLTIDGGTISEQAKMLRLALASGHIKQVFWAGRVENFAAQDIESWNEKRVFPHYLYDGSMTNDGSYLFSVSMTYNSLKIITNRPPSSKWHFKNIDTLNYWMTPKRASKYATYERANSFAKTARRARDFTFKKKAYRREYDFPAFDYHVAGIIKEHPDVEFVVLFTPEHNMALRAKKWRFGKYLAAQREFVNKLAAFQNVKVYGFEDDQKIVGNLANYRDNIHYHSGVNQYMLKEIAKGEGLLNKDTIGPCRGAPKMRNLIKPKFDRTIVGLMQA